MKHPKLQTYIVCVQSDFGLCMCECSREWMCSVLSVVVLTGISTAEEPGMVGSGRVPGMEAGRGCLCLFRRCSNEDREPGTGLRKTQRQTDIQRILSLDNWHHYSVLYHTTISNNNNIKPNYHSHKHQLFMFTGGYRTVKCGKTHCCGWGLFCDAGDSSLTKASRKLRSISRYLQPHLVAYISEQI